MISFIDKHKLLRKKSQEKNREKLRPICDKILPFANLILLMDLARAFANLEKDMLLCILFEY